MSHLDPERLALTASGDELTPQEQEHVDACDECALELAEFEHAADIARATAVLGPLETPPERVWDAIAADVRAARPEAPVPVRSRRSMRPAMFTLAASVAVLLVIAGIWAVVRPAQVVELASATLDAFPDHVGSEGEATVVETEDGQLEVRVALDSDPFDDGYREVWLITEDASDLVSLGVLEGRDGVFSVPADIDIHDFVLVDISQEADDGDPGHSGDSVVRGQLRFV